MNKETQNKQRWLRSGLLTVGVSSMAALVALLAAGAARVRVGDVLGTYRAIWLLDINWVAALVLSTVSVAATLGGLWLCWREWREMAQRLAKSGSNGSL